MNCTFPNACAILAVAISVAFASDAEAQNCNPPPAGTDSFAWAWGGNDNGQLGDGGTTIPWGRPTPIWVQNLRGAIAVAGGDHHSLAVKNDGTVWAWGENTFGQLGDGTGTDRYTPVQVHNLDGVTAVSAGTSHSLSVKSNGTVWAWGSNHYGELGNGSIQLVSAVPVQVQNLSGVTAVAAGDAYGLALKNDGTVWAWGLNEWGELGDGTTDSSSTPVQVQNLGGVTAIAAGSGYSLAVRNDGAVWAWGANWYGELGDGTTDDRHTPVQVQNLSGVTAVAARFHSLSLKSDCTVWAWGNNIAGQLGDGTTDERHTPVQVQNLNGIAAVGAGGEYSLALKNDGTVWSWGALVGADAGQSRTPVQAQNLGGVTAVAAGSDFNLAVAPVPTYLTVFKILLHTDHSRLRIFNLRIDGVVVRQAAGGGTTGRRLVSPGNHSVSETGGPGTPLSAFSTVIGGDCAADGTVELVLGDHKTCTITNYDHAGGCPFETRCCEPGDDTQGCQRCVSQRRACP